MRAVGWFVLATATAMSVGCDLDEPVELQPTSTPVDPTSSVPTVVDPTTSIPPCMPTEQAFQDNALPVIERNCTLCHGDPTDFGAPYPLLDYDFLVNGANAAGARPVDVMLTRLLDGTMPPASQGLMAHGDIDTLVSWASCGLAHPETPAGLESSRPVWDAPVDPPEGTTIIDLSADHHPVDVDDIDDYQYFTFRNLTDEDVFIRRMDGMIDESRVVHHIVLNYLIGFDYLYTWAPGTGAIEFPDGGLRLKPSDVLVMNIHYNNGAGIENVIDSSGIRLWVGPPEGTEYGMASPGVWDIDALPNTISSSTESCRTTMNFDVIAGMPHMHQIGEGLEHTVTRADGRVDSIVELTGWSFDSQFFYEEPIHINSGDLLTLTCTYDNPASNHVYWGEGTLDEMCFNFMYVTPPAAAFQCFF